MKMLLLLTFLGLAAGPEGAAPPPAKQQPAKNQELMVYAAASLREVFEELGRRFEAARPGTKVRLNLAGSQELRTQIEQGAEADVFASADAKHFNTLLGRGLVEPPVLFARNLPVLVVPKGNPAGINSLRDLIKAKRFVVGAPEVPIGAYTVKILEAAGRKYGAGFKAKVEAAVISRELNVRQVLAKVALGEADAGIVYRTDARSAEDKVDVIGLPSELNAAVEYFTGVVKATRRSDLARVWVDLLRSSEGQRQLTAAGFLAAP